MISVFSFNSPSCRCGRRSYLGLLLFFLFTVTPAAADIPFDHGLLFRVTNPQGVQGFVFGTVHSEDQRVIRMPQIVRQTFQGASKLALEMKMEPSVLLASVTAMVLTDGRTLEQVLGAKLYQRTVQTAAKIGLPEIAIRHYKPWAVATLLSVPPSESGMFLDRVLFETATQRGIEVVGLETAEEQLSVFDDMPEAEQIILLQDALNNFSKLPMVHEELLNMYLKRDLGGLVQLNDQMTKGLDADTAANVQESLIDSRNRRMVQRIKGHMSNGLFVAVGALHLPGRQGILNLLLAEGFLVERVY